MRLTSQPGWQAALDKLPWATWTPTVTAAAGSITSYTMTTARYLQLGSTVYYHVNILITDQGTAAGDLRLSAPVATNPSVWYWGSGREAAVVGWYINVVAVSSLLIMWHYDNTFPAITNRRLIVGGCYEV